MFTDSRPQIVFLILALAIPLANVANAQQNITGKSSEIGGALDLITSVPRTMSYQGILKDSGGDPVTDDVYSVTFRIFNVESGGTSLWDETLPCTTSAGLFNAVFGNVNLPFDEDYWLELEVASEILDPRQKMNMVGYAAVSDTADYAFATAAGGNGWVDDGNVVRLETDTDSVGIGTATPSEKLEVDGNLLATGKATIGLNNNNGGSYSIVVGENNYSSENWSTIGGGKSNEMEGECSVIGGGQQNSLMNWRSVIGGGYNNSIEAEYGSISGGSGNTISSGANFSSIGGGSGNYADGQYTSIGGGWSNEVTDLSYSTISGGRNNYSENAFTAIGGGENNETIASHSTVGGGLWNGAYGIGAAIAGGERNYAGADYSAILGGYADTITATGDYSYLFGVGSMLTQSYTFMVDMAHIRFGNEDEGYEFPNTDGSGGQVLSTDGAGQLSWTDPEGSASGWVDDGTVVRLETLSDMVGIGTDSPSEQLEIVGNILVNGNATIGTANTNEGSYTFVAGGNNWLTGSYAAIGGGRYNEAHGIYSTISGGNSNNCTNPYVFIGGGRSNAVGDGDYSTIAGGYSNYIEASTAFIGGGRDNEVYGPYSVIGGGYYHQNAGEYSAILGGYADTISYGADYSYLFGINSNLTQDSTIMVDMPHIRFGDEATGYEFPDSDGSDGQVMTTDGSGQISWTTISIPENGWSDDGNVVRLNSPGDSVGIGTSTPSEKLDVNGNIKSSGIITSGSTISIDGINNKITSTSGTISFDDENITTTGTITSGSSITIDGNNNRITSTSGSLSFHDENISTTGKATIGPGHTNSGNYAFAAGYYCTASGNYSVVSGGQLNRAYGEQSAAGGGSENYVHGDLSGVFSGSYNSAGGGPGDTAAFIGGGNSNEISNAKYASISGGRSNDVYGDYSAISGGFGNDAGNDVGDTAAYVGGGAGNIVRDKFSSICAGTANEIYGMYSSILGGYSNKIGNVISDDSASFIGGGYDNIIWEKFSTISGGRENDIYGECSTIGGGKLNEIDGRFSTISGGFSNIVGNDDATVGGGGQNTANGYTSTVGGGANNTASGLNSTVGGGNGNTASGECSVISGGCSSLALGDYSMAAGSGAKALHDGSFVWADASNDDFASTNENQIMMLASGGTWIYADPDLQAGVTIHPGASAWSTYSDADLKENLNPVNGKDILQKISSLPINEWNLKAQSDNIRHIGPTSQDFHNTFGLGENENTISTVDADGVALAGIKELIQENQELRQAIANLTSEIEALKDRIE